MNTEGARILDLPRGTGRLALQLARDGYRADAADASAHMISVASQIRQEEAVDGTEFPVRDLRRTGYPNGHFDAVVCNRLLHHYPSRGLRTEVLNELKRMSRGQVLALYFLGTP